MSSEADHNDVPEGWELLQEGKASVIYRHGESFYNPVQVVNRDMSVMMLRFYDDYRREKLAELSEGAFHPLLDPEAAKGTLGDPTVSDDSRSCVVARAFDEPFFSGKRRRAIKSRNGGKEDSNDSELPGMRVFEGLSATGVVTLNTVAVDRKRTSVWFCSRVQAQTLFCSGWKGTPHTVARDALSSARTLYRKEKWFSCFRCRITQS